MPIPHIAVDIFSLVMSDDVKKSIMKSGPQISRSLTSAIAATTINSIPIAVNQFFLLTVLK